MRDTSNERVFVKYRITWEGTSGPEEVFVWLPKGIEPRKNLWPLLNLVELDAEDYAYECTVVQEVSS